MISNEIRMYVINLERRPDRYQRIQAEAAKLGFELERINAVDGLLLDQNAITPFLSTSEIGCWRSHAIALAQVAHSENDICLILEDDAWLDDRAKLQSGLSYLKNLMHSNDLDLLQVGHVSELRTLRSRLGGTSVSQIFQRFFTTKTIKSKFGGHVLLGEFFAGAHAYLVSPGGAKILSSLAEQTLYPTDGLIEAVAKLSLRSNAKFKFGALGKSLIEQVGRNSSSLSLDSDIDTIELRL